MHKEVILIGGFHEIVELCEDNNYTIIGIIDNVVKKHYMGYPILGNDNDAYRLFDIYGKIPLVITPDSPLVRRRLFDLYSFIGFNFETIISKKSNISPSAIIANGVIIQSGVNVSSFSYIGNFVKLNTNVNVMHDSIIGDFSTIAPNAVILGRVKIQEEVYIGANSTILPEISITRNVTIGAGGVVTKNIMNKGIYVGIPVRKIK